LNFEFDSIMVMTCFINASKLSQYLMTFDKSKSLSDSVEMTMLGNASLYLFATSFGDSFGKIAKI
jgi:hypothetical protein